MRARTGGLAALWLLQMAGGPRETEFRYQREVLLPAAAVGAQSCAVLDGAMYTHAAPALDDVRLFRGEGAGAREVPYALTVSEAATNEDAAAVLNESKRGGHVVFDLRMPSRPYSDVRLDLGGAVNFLATATVTGLKRLGDPAPTFLGKFTVFDLTEQRLGRSTTLPLAESTFPFLHVDVAVATPQRPGERLDATMVRGAEVPPSREAQTLYTTVAEANAVVVRGRESVAEFDLPAHVPVERVSFALASGYTTNFSRSVRITAKAEEADGGEAPAREEVTGQISRVRMTQGGEVIRESSLGVPAILGSNLQSAAKVEVEVENGDDPPVGIRAVRLEMRQRKLCFAVPGEPVWLYSGADGVKAPMYDYSRVFQPAERVVVARLGPERENPGYVSRVDVKPFSERHPGLVWVGLVGVVMVLGGVAWRSAKRV